MMFKQMNRTTYGLLGILGILSLAVLVKGCERERQPAGPADPQRKKIHVTIPAPVDPQAKAASYRVEAMGVDANGKDIGPHIGPVIIDKPTFPLSVPITVIVPPCRYRFTISVIMSRDQVVREKQKVVDVCQQPQFDLTINTFETFQIGDEQVIDAPDPVNAGETIHVRCRVTQLDAPDSEGYPLTAELREVWEQDKRIVNGPPVIAQPFDVEHEAAGQFADPYAVVLPSSDQRTFTCKIGDGRSPDQTFTRIIRRIPPTPTPVPTSPSAPSAPSAPALPPCVVQNNLDTGADSLRQRLLDFQNGVCGSPITFAATVISPITVATELPIPAGVLTIDGGGTGMTISGGNTTRVFSVNSGANVTFTGLTITQGNAVMGAGIYNNGGTVTLANNSVVSGNAATGVGLASGGGIYSSGTLTVNGTVSGNSSAFTGAGIWISAGTATIAGTVRSNTAVQGAGIYIGGGTVTITNTGMVGGVAPADSNTASSSAGGIYFGGGTLTVNGTVRGNTSATNGGGIWIQAGIVTVNGTVSGNTATAGGGGIFNFAGTFTVTATGTVSGNTATGNGGGIYNNGGTAKIYGTVGGTAPGSGNSASAAGGGIVNAGGTLIISDTVSGATGKVIGNRSTSNGGGIYLASGTLTLNLGNLIEGNHCDNDNAGGETGGGIYLNVGACPVPGANYGGGNYRGSGTGVSDDCKP